MAIEISIGELATIVGGQVQGDPTKIVKSVCQLETAGPNCLAFIFEKKYESMITRAGAIVVGHALDRDCAQIVVPNPRLALAQVLTAMYPDWQDHPFESVQTPTSAMGPGTQIFGTIYVGIGCKIGRDCRFYPGVTLYPGTEIGDRVTIHAGSVIGSDGFGYQFHDGRYIKIPHIGRVIIGADVEIGANVTIDRGCLGKTVIGAGTKIDNLVQIAHNVEIGENCAFASQVGISGGVQIGNHVAMAGQVGVNGHVQIGNGVVVLSKAGVTKSISEKQTISGFPAQNHHQEKIDQILLRNWIKSMRKGVNNGEK